VFVIITLVVSVLGAIGALGVIVATVRRRRVAVAPLADLRPGAFDELVARRLPPPEVALQVVRHETAPKTGPGTRHRLPIGESAPVGTAFAAAAWGSAFADGVAPALGV
jgi:hypothetical protein